MCTMSPYDLKLQDVHRDLAWMTGPEGLVRKAEQPVHFLKDPEEKPISAPLWGSLTAPLQTGKRLSNMVSNEQS